MSNLIIFGMPRGSAVLAVKVNRRLKGIGAEKVQRSVWRSDNLRELTRIAVWIRNAGGSAQILEEKVIY